MATGRKPPITREQLITSWACALDAAAAAAESAYANKVVSAAELKDLLRSLRVERAWLGRFEQDSPASFL